MLIAFGIFAFKIRKEKRKKTENKKAKQDNQAVNEEGYEIKLRKTIFNLCLAASQWVTIANSSSKNEIIGRRVDKFHLFVLSIAPMNGRNPFVSVHLPEKANILFRSIFFFFGGITFDSKRKFDCVCSLASQYPIDEPE